MALLSLERVPMLRSGLPRLGGFRQALSADLNEARRLQWADRLVGTGVDLGAPLGVLLYVGSVGAHMLIDQPSTEGLLASAMLLALPFLTGTRLHLPLRPQHKLLMLRGAARRFTLEGVACALMVHEPAGEPLQDARLRLNPARVPDGLLRLDVAIADRPGPGGFTRELVLVAVTREATLAEAALSDLRCHDQQGASRRVGRVWPLEPTVLSQVLTHLAAVCDPRDSSGEGSSGDVQLLEPAA
jgi:hypothetical protein